MGVEANLVHYGAVTLQDHESPVYHATGAPLNEEEDVGLFNVTQADKIHKFGATEIQVYDKDSLKQTHSTCFWIIQDRKYTLRNMPVVTVT